MSDTVTVTTIRQGDPLDPVERLRAEIFLDTARVIQLLKLPCVAVYVDCSDEYLAAVRSHGVHLVPQRSQGMGNVRREALRAARDHFPATKYYCWLEPEKSCLPWFIAPLRRRMAKDGAVLGLFNRKSMASYPKEQAHYYLFCRAVATALIGRDVDYAFGPMMLIPECLPYFIEYEGEYGDLWESILLPRLRVIKSGARYTTLSVSFKNDPRMTTIEAGNPDMILKRLAQFNNVIPSLVTEWAK